jgi:crotonobetainyl-CoA:carnitine CoA-transferase CaiB-like acyl-CoA transferase
MAPHGVYRCLGEDAWVAIAVRADAEWPVLCAVIERLDLAADAGLRTAAGRRARADELDGAIAAWCAHQPVREVERRLQHRGIAAGAVLNAREMLTDPHLSARLTHPTVLHPDVGPAPVPAVAWHFKRSPVRPVKAAPRFGEDTETVLAELLKMSEDAIAALYTVGVTARAPTTGGH